MENQKIANISDIMNAKIIEIVDLGEDRTLKLSDELDSMILEYIVLHNEFAALLNTNKGIRWDKLNMIRRLSQYGLGLHKLGEAYKELNPVRGI